MPECTHDPLERLLSRLAVPVLAPANLHAELELEEAAMQAVDDLVCGRAGLASLCASLPDVPGRPETVAALHELALWLEDELMPLPRPQLMFDRLAL